MGGLRALVVFLGLVIAGMVATIVVTLVHRHAAAQIGSAPSASIALTLDEPAGTHIAQISAVGDRLAVLLQGGGGPDRVVWLDQTGRVAFRLQLRH
jgi:hypothetical protein